jgi:hypothetical protein
MSRQSAQHRFDPTMGYGTLVAGSAGLYALGLLALAAPRIGGTFTWDGDIISRAVLLAYPKGRETVIYLLACLLVPALAGGAVLAWRRLAAGGSLRADALAHLPLPAWIGYLFIQRGPLWVWILAPLSVHLLLRLALRARGHAMEPVASPPGDAPAVVVDDTEKMALATAWGRLILAGCACGLSLFPHLLGGLDPKSAALIRSLAGVALLTALWLGLSALPLTRLGRGFSQRAAALSAPFTPLALLLLRHLIPNDGPRFTVLCGGLLAASAAWLLVLLVRGAGADGSGRVFWRVVVPLSLYALAYVHVTADRIDLYHEGERIVPAMASSDGAVPYRDVFLWHGLFENDTKGRLAFALVEESVAGMRRFEALLAPLAAVAFFILARACCGSPLGGLICTLLLLHWVAPPNVRYFLPYLALALLATWLRRRDFSAALPAGAGALAALAVFHSLDGGMGVLASAILLLGYGVIVFGDGGPAERAVQAGRVGGAFAAGALAGALVPLTWLMTVDALLPFLGTSADIVFGLSDRSSHPYTTLMPLVGKPLKMLVTYLPALVILWGLGHLAARFPGSGLHRPNPGLVVPLAGALVFFRAVIRRPDIDHVTKLTPLIFLLLLILVAHHGAGLLRGRWSGRTISLAALVPLCGLLVLLGLYKAETPAGQSLSGLRHDPPLLADPDLPMRELSLERAGAGVADVDMSASWIEGVARFLEQHLEPGEPFYDFTNMGLLHFLADRPGPTRFVQTTYAASRGAQQEVVADLTTAQPRYVTFPSGNMRKYDYDRILHPLRHPLITRHLYRHYRPFTVIGDTILLVQKERSGHQRSRALNMFLRKESFASKLGHLPRLFAGTGERVDTVREWDAAGIENGWRAVGPSKGACRTEGERFILTAPKGEPKLSSPQLALDPRGNDALLLRLAAERDLEVALYWRTRGQQQFGKQTWVTFTVVGDGTARDYRVDLGLLPNWVWRGKVAAVQLRVRGETGPLLIERIGLVSIREQPLPAIYFD